MVEPSQEVLESKADVSYTEPFGLMARLQRPPIRLDVVPVLDMLVIALLFGLLFTRFVMVPGVRVDLPDTEMQMQPSNLPVSVLTIGNGGMLFFDGAVFEINSIERGFQHHIAELDGRNAVLLIKTQGTMDLQLFLKLCHMAQKAGFVQAQVAGEHLPEVNSVVPIESVEGLDGGFLPVK